MSDNIREIPGIVLHRHGNKNNLPQFFEGEGGYTDDTLEWLMNIGGQIVNMNGSLWHMGTAISGTSTTTGAYSYSACPLVKVGDCYLNTSYGYVYQCTTAGSGASAKWTYKGSIRGATGAAGTHAAVDSALSSTSANPVQNKAVTKAVNDTNNRIDNFLNTTEYISISEIADAINGKMDNYFNSNGYVGIDEVTEALDDRLPHTTITTATDMNTLQATGIYHIASHNCVNRPPSNNWGTVFVDFTTGTPYQIYIDDGANRTIYKRSYANGSWSAWDALTSNTKINPNDTTGDILDGNLTINGDLINDHGQYSLGVAIINSSGVSCLPGSTPTLDGYGKHSFLGCQMINAVGGNSCVFINSKSMDYTGNQKTIQDCTVINGSHAQIKCGNTVIGRYNSLPVGGSMTSGTAGDVLVVGIGTSSGTKNGFRVDYSGKCFAYNTMSSTGADYAEVWEWADGNPNNEDRVGRFVAFEGTKIRLAGSNDPKEILGIISAMPAIAGDNFADEWQGMYLKDKFGRLLTEHKSYEAEYEDITVTYEETGEETTETRLVHPAYEADEFIVNPEYDPEQEYIPRMERPEFDAVGTHGKLVVIDDGTCEVGGFCMSGENGVATASESGFYVMERIDENTIKVYVR